MMQLNPQPDSQSLFDAAVELEPRARAAFLDRVCAGDQRLRKDVESLLAADGEASSFLDRPALDLGCEGEAVVGSSPVGTRVGAFRLVELAAHGGMGSVYRAERADGTFEQQVAIKIIRTESWTPGASRRFARERQTLAQLEHPYITRLLDGGVTADGRPYLAMEYVDGRPIDQYCREESLPLTARLELFRRICDAVHFAHTRLVVHRDLKPANILVTSGGAPKVLDFGIAKLLSESANLDATVAAANPMTPRYASPEQIRGDSITTASDVFALGIILYELLTDRHPLAENAKSGFEVARLICEHDPPPPSAASRGLRIDRDLDQIVLMAIHKEPKHRYASVQQLSEDIERYLEGRPVIARRPTTVYRVVKWTRRNRAVAVVSALLVVATGVGFGGTTAGMLRARFAQSRAEAEREAAVRSQRESEAVAAFLQDVLGSANPFRYGRDRSVGELLEDAGRRIDSELSGMPGVEAAVRFAVANTYAGMWSWREAVPHLRKTLALQRQLYGSRDARLARTLSLLGRALTFQRDPAAIALQREGLRIRRELFGALHRETAESLGNLGYSLWHTSAPPQWAEAEACYREALLRYEALGITDDADVARFTFSLAVMLRSLSRFDESEPLFLRANDMYARLPVTQDCYRVRSLREYAILLDQMGRCEEAGAILDEAQQISPPSMLPPLLLAR